MPISLSPDDAVKGGLLDQVTVEFSNCRFTSEPPEGYTVRDRVFYKADLTIVATGEKTEGYWSFGDLTKCNILDDGDKVDGPPLNDNTNFFFLAKSLQDKGFPKDKLKTGSASALNGLVAHLIRFTPKREGLPEQADATKKRKNDPSVLIVEEIKQLPGEKAGSRTRAAAAKTGTAAADAEMTPEALDKLASDTVIGVVAAEKDGIPYKGIKVAVFRAFSGKPVTLRDAVVAKAENRDWIASQGLTITEDGTLKM